MQNKFLKPLDFPLRWLLHPALLFAIGLHLLALFVPLPQFKSQPEAASPDASPNASIQTAITRLPSPTPQKSSQPTASPQPAALLALPQAQRPKPKPSTLPAPAPAQAARPVEPPAQPSPAPAASPAASPDSLPAANLAVPFADFPDLAEATTGCFGSSHCRQIQGTPFRDAAQTLVQQMTDQNYQVSERSDLEDTGQKVYQIVAQDGTTRYLSVLSAEIGSTVYMLATEPILLSDLQQVETVEAKLAALLTPIGRPANTTQLPHPSLFLAGTQARPEISQMRLVPGVAPKQLVSSFTNTLKSNEFSLAEVGSYGGGSIYEVSQKAWIGYLNFVPTADQTGTVVIWWQSLPPA